MNNKQEKNHYRYQYIQTTIAVKQASNKYISVGHYNTGLLIKLGSDIICNDDEITYISLCHITIHLHVYHQYNL